MGILSEEFTAKLVRDKELKADLRIRASSFVHKTVDKRLLSDYEGTGWEQEKENKRTVVLRKPKPHNDYFEDRIWTLLSKMGFTTMGKQDLKLPYTDDDSIPGKQIDVFAADDETILVVECKSAEEMKRQNFSKELNEYEKVIIGGTKALKKEFSKTHKIKYIFATNNISLGDNDKKRLADLKMTHLNHDEINYYEQLQARLGQSAKYQLLAKLFKGQDIHSLENKIPAVRGQMGGYNYYSFSIEPEKLLKISYILHRINVNDDDDGYQRLPTKKRLGDIENFINKSGYFPNSVILNINTKREEPLYFDRLASKHDSKITEPVILHLPKQYHSAFVIDGQHRLYGYSNTEYKGTNSIPVVAFENLLSSEQINLFVQINSNQQPVSPNLLTTMSADLMWNSDKYDSAIEGLMSRLLSRLGTHEDSPLYNRIAIGDTKKTPKSCITMPTIIAQGLSKTNFFAKLNRKKLIETGHLWCDPVQSDGTFEYKAMLDKSLLFFKTYFDYIRQNTEDIWNLGSGQGGFVTMNIGINCFIRIASDILDCIKKYGGEDYSIKSGKEIAELTFNYLEPIFTYINNFEPTKIAQFRNYSSNPKGVDNAVREFQQEVHNKFKVFDPDGLQKWIIENSGKYKDVARVLADRIEDGIKRKVYAVLEEKYGSSWWKDGVHQEERMKAAVEKIKANSDDPEQDFLYLIDYKKIISRKWDLFKNIFADPAFKSNKDDQLQWFDTLNPIRNQASHGRNVSQEDFAFLTKLNEWLPARIGIDKLNTAV